MIVKRTLLLLFTILFFTSFGNDRDVKKMVKNQLLDVYFSAEDKQEIVKIIQFTDSIVISKCPSTSMNNSYHLYMDSVWKQAQNHNMQEALNILCINHEKKINFLHSLDESLFYEIWRYNIFKDSVKIKGEYVKIENPIIQIDLRPNNSKISNYFKAVGNSDEKFKEIFEVMSISGSLGIVWMGTYNNLDKFDFSKIEDRLWASLILLTLDCDIGTLLDRV